MIRCRCRGGGEEREIRTLVRRPGLRSAKDKAAAGRARPQSQPAHRGEQTGDTRQATEPVTQRRRTGGFEINGVDSVSCPVGAWVLSLGAHEQRAMADIAGAHGPVQCSAAGGQRLNEGRINSGGGKVAAAVPQVSPRGLRSNPESVTGRTGSREGPPND